MRRGAILVVISDFIATGYDESFRRASRLHDLIAVRVVDPREEALPSVGLVRVADLETGAEDEVDSSDPQVRAAWSARAAARRTSLESLTRRAGADYVEVRTGEDYVEPLRRLFARRRRRRRHVQPKGTTKVSKAAPKPGRKTR